jgi:hypothetical protein
VWGDVRRTEGRARVKCAVPYKLILLINKIEFPELFASNLAIIILM